MRQIKVQKRNASKMQKLLIIVFFFNFFYINIFISLYDLKSGPFDARIWEANLY